MDKKLVLDTLGRIGLIPVAVLDYKECAVPLAKALSAGGIKTVEVTLRTEAGMDSIPLIKEHFPEFLVGAGSVLSADQAMKAIQAGADYIVSPGFSPEIAALCGKTEVTYVPGCATATEIQSAVTAGFTTLKFFPATECGGIKACKALFAPFGKVKFIPTGGIDLQNIKDYAECGCVHAIGGGWLCPRKDIMEENWEKITETAGESVKRLLDFRVVHVGINTPSREEALKISNALSDTFGFPISEGKLSTFVGEGFEVNHFNCYGSKGHVAIDTNSIPRAEYHLGLTGIAFREESRVVAEGKTLALYLQNEFGGFAVHLRQRKFS